jgi:hypothetical protein
MRPTAALVALATGAAACGGAQRTALLLDIQADSPAARPEYALIRVAGPAGEPTEQRFPASGAFPASATRLGSVYVALDEARPGARTITVTGMNGGARVSSAMATASWRLHTLQHVTLVLSAPAGGALDAGPGSPRDGPAAPDAAAPDAPPPALDRPAGPEAAPDDTRPPAVDATAAPDARDAVPPSSLSNGLVAYYRLDDAVDSATAKDSSGNGNHAALRGVAPAQAWVQGKLSTAVQLPGGAWLQAPDSPSLNTITRSLTIAAWINRDAYAKYETVLSRQYMTTSSEHYGLFFDDSGKLTAWMYNTAQVQVCTDATASPDQQWIHVAFTYDGTTGRIYRNGAEVCAAAKASPPRADTRPLIIGGNPMDGTDTAGYLFHGRLDEVLLYSRALGADEIARLAKGEQPPQK